MKKFKSNEEYKNEYNRQNYDRIGLMIPKGQKELWQEEAKRRDLSLNAFIIECVKNCTDVKNLCKNEENG